MFQNLKSDGLEKSQDRVGGFDALETDLYTGKIKVAYAGKSTGGAHSLTVVVGLDNGKEYRETLWITNKKGENWFLNKQDASKKVPLPGFTVAEDLCLCATEKSLSEQTFEEKVVKIYDYDAKAELPKAVQAATDLIGMEVTLAIIKQTENKNKLEGSEYVATAETRNVNLIDKVFHTATGFSVAEIRNNAEKPAFKDAWLERNKGVTRDKRTIKEGGTAGAPKAAGSKAPTAAPTAGAAAEPRKSLFGKK